MKSEAAYQAPALAKGLEVLEFLSGQTEPYAVSELARALGRSRNEIYRMVVVLERSGYLWRTDADRFSLTRKLFDLGMRAPPQQNLLIKALPTMQRLSQETFQSCHLTVASGSAIVVVARIESPDTLGFRCDWLSPPHLPIDVRACPLCPSNGRDTRGVAQDADREGRPDTVDGTGTGSRHDPEQRCADGDKALTWTPSRISRLQS